MLNIESNTNIIVHSIWTELKKCNTWKNCINLLDECCPCISIEVRSFSGLALICTIIKSRIVAFVHVHYAAKFKKLLYYKSRLNNLHSYHTLYHFVLMSLKGFSTVDNRIWGLLVSNPRRNFKWSLIYIYYSYLLILIPLLSRCLYFFFYIMSFCHHSGEKVSPLRMKNQ